MLLMTLLFLHSARKFCSNYQPELIHLALLSTPILNAHWLYAICNNLDFNFVERPVRYVVAPMSMCDLPVIMRRLSVYLSCVLV